MARLASAAVLASTLLAACAPRLASRDEPRAEEVSVGAARFRIVHSREDAAAARQVRRALERAAPRVARWGGLPHPVTVRIHPTHVALEEAIPGPGYDWLKAWARFDTVDLKSPRTWSFFGASDARVEEVVTHELTHCAMYQRAGGERDWMYRQIPRWFSEGIATVTAGQGARYGGIGRVHAFYARRREAAAAGRDGDGAPAGDPILDPDPLYRQDPDVVYAASHHAAELLLARYGEDRVVRILRLMGEGSGFPAAFAEAIGITAGEFAVEFRRYAVEEGGRR